MARRGTAPVLTTAGKRLRGAAVPWGYPNGLDSQPKFPFATIGEIASPGKDFLSPVGVGATTSFSSKPWMRQHPFTEKCLSRQGFSCPCGGGCGNIHLQHIMDAATSIYKELPLQARIFLSPGRLSWQGFYPYAQNGAAGNTWENLAIISPLNSRILEASRPLPHCMPRMGQPRNIRENRP